MKYSQNDTIAMDPASALGTPHASMSSPTNTARAAARMTMMTMNRCADACMRLATLLRLRIGVRGGATRNKTYTRHIAASPRYRNRPLPNDVQNVSSFTRFSADCCSACHASSAKSSLRNTFDATPSANAARSFTRAENRAFQDSSLQ